MSIRRKVGRIRFLIAAMLLAISTLALPASAQPAVAQAACTPSEPNTVQSWSTVYDDRGVTLCRGDHSDPIGTPEAMVQIVDLAAGAKLRLISDAVDPLGPPAANSQYRKRFAGQWFDWIQSTVTSPAASRLFSTTNASFFKDTSSSTTALSFPEMSMQRFPVCPIQPGVCSVQHFTLGWTHDNHGHPDWDADKRGLRMGPPSASTQRVEIFAFDTHYDQFDVASAFDLLGTEGPACGKPDRCWDATVAFDPLYGSGSSPRTFFGMDASNKVYILTAADSMTLSEAQDILDSFGSVTEVQLDGGGSTQLYYEVGGVGDGFSVLSRAVPDVLAVYLGP